MSTSALRVSVLAVILLLPAGQFALPGVGLSVVLAAMAAPAVLAALSLLRGDPVPGPSWLLGGLAISVLIGLTSVVFAEDVARAVVLIVISLLSLGYCVAIGMSVDSSARLRSTLVLTVLVGGVIAAWSISQLGSLQAASGGGVVTGRPTGIFAQPNELGLFCAALLPVAAVAVTTAESTISRLLRGSAALALSAAWVMSMSRGAWVGGLTGLALLAVCLPAVRVRLAVAGALAAAGAAIAVLLPATSGVLGVLGARLRTLTDASNNAYDQRPAIWDEAWRQAAERPWFGSGPGGYEALAGEAGSRLSWDPPIHPHNLFLTTLTEHGVIGACAGAVIVLACGAVLIRGWAVVHRRDPSSRSMRRDAAWGVAAVAGLSAIAVQGFFDMPLRNPIVTATVWTLLGCAVATESTVRNWTTSLAAHRGESRVTAF